MDVITRSRTPREDARSPFGSSQEAKKKYSEYLQTPHWRKTRDLALKRAGWRCQRCEARKRLEVHHKTYERLGSERPEDLEVLCSTCHDGHHFTEEVNGPRLYMRIVSAVLERERFESVSDLSAAVRDECSRLKVPYQPDSVNSAIRTVDANRAGVVDAPRPKPVDPSTYYDRDRPVTHQEAVGIIRERLRPKMTFREIPTSGPLPQTRRQKLASQALELITEAMESSLKRCAELETKERPVFGEKA